jgi:hypothetical protein
MLSLALEMHIDLFRLMIRYSVEIEVVQTMPAPGSLALINSIARVAPELMINQN